MKAVLWVEHKEQRPIQTGADGFLVSKRGQLVIVIVADANEPAVQLLDELVTKYNATPEES